MVFNVKEANEQLQKKMRNKEKPYVCGMINKKTGEKCCWRSKTREALEKHQHTKIHNPIIQKRKYKRPVSGIFTSYNQLKLDCKFCGKMFSQSQSRVRHEITEHKKESRYKCPICNIDLLRCDRLKKHMKTTHNETLVYTCSHLDCKEKFQMKAELIEHKKNVHKIK